MRRTNCHKETLLKADTTEPRCTVQYATMTEPTKQKTILLHVIPVKISSSEGRFITTYGLLDNGSDGTMISSDVAKELGLKGSKEVISVSTLLQQEDKEFEVVEFKLQSASGEGESSLLKKGLYQRNSTSWRRAFQKILTGDHTHT